MQNSNSPVLAILGVGGIGLPIARLWSEAGHEIALGSRDPGRLRTRLAPHRIKGEVSTLVDAAASADVVLLSVPYPALEEVIEQVGPALADTIVIDATNPMGLSDEGHIRSTLGSTKTSGETTAELLPESHVVRAFSHVMEELLWPRGTTQRHFWGMALSGDDTESKKTVAALINDAGFTPVDIGTLAESQPLDPGGVLFPHMFTPADLARTVGAGTPVAVR
ncbi:NADPH-dependent F420 reductase [Amycolatopsis ultiminotia]|uniref:NADPH-dependent F420 reductase n=1 Tax=Amycolatopsis ultiminotia TaxID=543629 RepID=A0ABP6VMR9_9PSEU